MTDVATTATLRVGETAIPYDVRRSDRALRKRIVVRPEGVEVVVPPDVHDQAIHDYVHRKRRWVFDAVREIAEKHEQRLIQHFASGAKLQYRGRHLMLVVRPCDVDRVHVECRNRFHVRVPAQLTGPARTDAVRQALVTWLRDRALRDSRRFSRRHAPALGVEPAGVRLGDQKHSWGTCGKDRVLRIHWRLVQAPAAAMEYVVAHELAHLLHRHHGPEFWRALERAMPDWAERKAALEAWEVGHREV